MISHQAITLQGMTAEGDYVSATVNLRLHSDGRLEVFDAGDWRALDVPVHRVPVTPAEPLTLDQMRYLLAGGLITDANYPGRPVDLGDDPDGDLGGYDGAGA